MKTTSTLNTVLAAAATAALALSAPSVHADTQNKSFTSKLKSDSNVEATNDTHKGNRTITHGTTQPNSRTMASQDKNKSLGSSLKFWDRDKDSSASRSDSNHRDQTHRSVMMKKNDTKRHEASAKNNSPSIWDRMMFWRHDDRS